MFFNKQLKFGIIFLLSIILIGSTHKPVLAKKKKSDKKSILTKEPHSPHKATIYSLALPGLGQAYNKKYWKIPIIYAGFGAMAYFIVDNKNGFNRFSDTYEFVNGDLTKTPYDDWATKYTSDQLKNARDLYKRNLDLSYILTGLWYLLNVVDASVDAHLFEFEVNDDLSLKVEPDIKMLPNEYKPYTGIRVSFSIPLSKH